MTIATCKELGICESDDCLHCNTNNSYWPSEPEYPDDNVVRYDAYDGCWMVGNVDAYEFVRKYEGKAIKIVEI